MAVLVGAVLVLVGSIASLIALSGTAGQPEGARVAIALVRPRLVVQVAVAHGVVLLNGDGACRAVRPPPRWHWPISERHVGERVHSDVPEVRAQCNGHVVRRWLTAAEWRITTLRSASNRGWDTAQREQHAGGSHGEKELISGNQR